MTWPRPRQPPRLIVANWRDVKHPEAGGAEACCEQLARRIAATGRRVVFLTAAVRGRPGKETRDGFTVRRLGGRFSVYPLALLWLMLHRRSIDAVIDSQNGIPFFTPLAVRRRTPVVLLMHHVHQEQFAVYFPSPMAAVARWLESTGSRWVYGHRVVAAMSPSTRKSARRQLGLQGPIFVVPPGWEISGGPPFNPGERIGAPRIVCVGRLVPHKRVHLIVEAFAQVVVEWPDVELHIVGDGPAREHLARLVERLGLAGRVHLRGALDSEERDRLLSTASLTVNASQAEGWALTVIEANALGVPVLGFRVPGLRDSIRSGETGWLIDEDEALSAGILRALAEVEDEDRARQLSRQAQEWASRFNWQETTDQMVNLLDAERGRLAHSRDDRRDATDLAMVAFVPHGLLPDGWQASARITDRVTVSEAGVAVLLPATDADSAWAALRRSGLPRALIGDWRVTVTVARPTDYVSPWVTPHHQPVVDLRDPVQR